MRGRDGASVDGGSALLFSLRRVLRCPSQLSRSGDGGPQRECCSREPSRACTLALGAAADMHAAALDS